MKLIPRAKTMRQAPSEAEHRLWQKIRNRQLDDLEFRRQQPVGPFIADFACDECKITVEVDGSQHDQKTAIQYDEKRTSKLDALGGRVLRFYAGDVVKDIDAVLDTILSYARPHPNPLSLNTTGKGTRRHS